MHGGDATVTQRDPFPTPDTVPFEDAFDDAFDDASLWGDDDGLEQTLALVRALPQRRAPRGFARRVMQQLPTPEPTPSPTSKIPWTWPAWQWPFRYEVFASAMLAACALMLIAGQLGAPQHVTSVDLGGTSHTHVMAYEGTTIRARASMMSDRVTWVLASETNLRHLSSQLEQEGWLVRAVMTPDGQSALVVTSLPKYLPVLSKRVGLNTQPDDNRDSRASSSAEVTVLLVVEPRQLAS